jgi:hypothetical protein
MTGPRGPASFRVKDALPVNGPDFPGHFAGKFVGFFSFLSHLLCLSPGFLR